MVKIGWLGLMIAFLILTGGLFGQVHADIPELERADLTALYNSTNGYSWSNNVGWKNPPLHEDGFALPGTECNWYGVVCTGDSVTALSLYDNQLTGSIPAELGNLTNLQYLSLYDNQLTGSIPAELGNLTNLQYLSLYGNQLTGSIPVELMNMTSLSFLDICNNHLYTTNLGLRDFLTNLQPGWESCQTPPLFTPPFFKPMPWIPLLLLDE